MVFNSFQFLGLFLPFTLILYYFSGRQRKAYATCWLIVASFIFYGSWDWRFIPIILLSIGVNFIFAKWILVNRNAGTRWRLASAVIFNLGLLGFFKYSNFFITAVNDVSGSHFALLQLILPIGISFFTFTQISLLVDAHQGKLEQLGFAEYLLFVSYFPYIVAGPILHHREMLPQFATKENYQFRVENFSIGISLFIFGLSKKLLLADNLSPLINPAFNGGTPQMLPAWLAMLAYTLQLYFDFSGYSDMAIGVSRLFGFRIPINFHSPYKATCVSDFWLRWHISLSRFLRNYLYIPLGGNRHGHFNRYRNLLLTMLLGGLWHGSNWTFVIWGGLHGLYLCVQHGWQHLRGTQKVPTTFSNLCNRTLTFLAVMVAWCFFRAPNVTSAFQVLGGMVGLHGISGSTDLDPLATSILVLCAFIAFFMPNTNEIFLSEEETTTKLPAAPSVLAIRWSTTAMWGLVLGCIFALSLFSIEQTKDFIYAQF